MKNWKSTLAFIVFVSVYVYTVVFRTAECSSAIVDVTGYIALYSAVAMMLRNDMTPQIIEKLIDKLGTK